MTGGIRVIRPQLSPIFVAFAIVMVRLFSRRAALRTATRRFRNYRASC